MHRDFGRSSTRSFLIDNGKVRSFSDQVVMTVSGDVKKSRSARDGELPATVEYSVPDRARLTPPPCT